MWENIMEMCEKKIFFWFRNPQILLPSEKECSGRFFMRVRFGQTKIIFSIEAAAWTLTTFDQTWQRRCAVRTFARTSLHPDIISKYTSHR
jgi:hypothetical protein